MKYIRTEDNEIGIIFKDLIEENTYHIQTKDKITSLFCDKEGNLKYLGKISDTIEELCDEFIRVCDVFKIKEVLSKEEKRRLLDKELITNKITYFYGAIWTDRGLIYVAKMNDKGELELL